MQISFLTGEDSVSWEELKEIMETLKPLAECDKLTPSAKCDELTIGISEKIRVTGVRIKIFYKKGTMCLCYEITFYGRNPKTGRPDTIGWGRYSARQVRNLDFNDSFRE